MPIYEYQCSICGHQLDAFQNIKDEPLKECPNCHKNSLNKLISAAGFQLKGTGWYKTDYTKKPSGESKSAEKSTEASTEGKAESTKTENQQTNTSKPTETKSDKIKTDKNSNKTGSTS